MLYFLKSIVVWILTILARLALAKYKPRIVAITGTVGKTTTKDAVYAALSGFFRVRKSEKSFNSDIGIPLTILGCPNPGLNPFGWLSVFLKGARLACRKSFDAPYPEWLVIEVGADRPGDIKKIGRWLCPHIAVITRFAEVPAHIEFFDSAEAVVSEKAELARSVPPGGMLVLGSDDKEALRLRRSVERAAVTFGTDFDAEVRGEEYEIAQGDMEDKPPAASVPVGIRFTVRVGNEVLPVFIAGGVGRQLMQAALAAFAVGVSLSLDVKRVGDALQTFSPPPGRMRIVRGIRESIIIDDSYNSSPAALSEALLTLRSVPALGRRIAVLGDMLELGKFTGDEHRKAGIETAASSDMLVTAGLRARGFVRGAAEAGMGEKQILTFENSMEAGRALKEILTSGDVVLVKGSQRMRMERVVKACMAEPARAKEFLARQEKEWELQK